MLQLLSLRCPMVTLQDNFIDLVDCLLGPTGGYKLSLDYGANFEALCRHCRHVSVSGKNGFAASGRDWSIASASTETMMVSLCHRSRMTAA